MSAPKNILVATDFGEASREALKYAFGLAAESDGAKVHLVHVVTLKGMLEAAAPDHERLEDADAAAHRTLRALTRAYEPTGYVGTLHAPMGEPAAETLRVAHELGADLIVLGTHGRGRLRQLLVGSVARRVYRHAACPVVLREAAQPNAVHAA